MGDYFQKYNTETKRWIKITKETNMIVDIDVEPFGNIPFNKIDAMAPDYIYRGEE